MNETTLPPAPNWYLNNILACSKRGTVAWGTKNVIIIVRHKEDYNTLNYSVIKDAHKEKVVALAFCSKCELDTQELLISGGDDDKVRIWNIDTLDLVTIFSFGDNKPVVGVDWSIKDNNFACAINSEGCLMSCQTQYESCKIISMGKLIATCLACCPHDANLVAIGSKTGLVYIVDVRKDGCILYKMRGHDVEVVSLSWCPSEINVLSGKDEKDLLLASGAKDKRVFIWRAGRDGRYETIITLPNQPIATGCQQHKSKLNAAVGCWITVCWVEPKVLLTSSIWGELLSWDLSTNKTKPICNLLHTYHTRGLFCIVTIPKNDTISDNWRIHSEFIVWTLAQDRWVICCQKQKDGTMSVKCKIPAQGGYVYCIATCPLDTSYIAIGVGDAMLRLWNLSECHKTTFDITMLWQKIKGKLRAVSWHPEKENLLAFGTSEGRIGLFDTNVLNKPPVLYRQYHRNTVYKLEWGPMPGYKHHFLYSCAEGELVTYNRATPNEEPRHIIKKECTEFSWKPNYSCLAIALENGSINFYNRNLEKCGNAVNVLKKTINCLVWHPDSTATDVSLSLMRNYLAVASDSTAIIIFDVSELVNDLEEVLKNTNEECTVTENSTVNANNHQQRTVQKIVATLNGHSDRVVCLAWSPHFSGHLVSGSYDNTAQVWNVETEELMGTFTGHNGPVLCCMWSPFKPQLIMTGSADLFTYIWDYSLPAQSPKQPVIVSKKKNKQNGRKTQKDKVEESKAQNNPNISVASANQPAICASEKFIESQVVPVKDVAKKKTERRSYFAKHNKAINEKFTIINCIENDIRKTQGQNSNFQDKETDCDVTKLSLFSENENFSAILANEKAAYTAQNKHNIVTEMDMWCNGLKQNLECAAKEKRLDDFLVSLSPNLSIKIWKEMCETYAHQLILEGNIEKAVSYLLCIHKTYEAIEIFSNAKMYKEAYVLARCKLDADDPVITNILQAWAQHSIHRGQLEQAAHCYIKLEDFMQAAKTLARRKDAHCLEIASQLALISGDEEFHMSLVKEAITRAIMELNYTKAYSIIANNPGMQYLEVHAYTHELLLTTYNISAEPDSIQTWLKGNSDFGMLQAVEEKYSSTSYYSALCDNTSNATPENETMMRLQVSRQIAMAVTCDTRETRLKHIATALNITFQYEEVNVNRQKGFFLHILTKLEAKKPINEESIYAKDTYPVSKSIRAYLCVGLLNYLLNNFEQLSIEEEIELTYLIQDLLEDILERATVKYWSWTAEINKLESQLASLMINDKTNNTENEEEDATILAKKLDKLKLDKRDFMKDRVYVPNPITVYCKASELGDKLRDDANKSRFLEILTYIWTKAIE